MAEDALSSIGRLHLITAENLVQPSVFRFISNGKREALAVKCFAKTHLQLQYIMNFQMVRYAILVVIEENRQQDGNFHNHHQI